MLLSRIRVSELMAISKPRRFGMAAASSPLRLCAVLLRFLCDNSKDENKYRDVPFVQILLLSSQYQYLVAGPFA